MGPTIVINGVIHPDKWPKINGSNWGYFNPKYAEIFHPTIERTVLRKYNW